MLPIFRKRSAGLNAGTTAARLLPSGPEFLRLIDRERERANRNQHCVSLVLISLAELRGASQPVERIIRSIQTRIRRVDEVGWYDAGRLGILLPYTNRTGACRLTADIVERLGPTPSQFTTEVFTFPADTPGEAANEGTGGAA
jgi:hypothetical protein